jgi:CheY-like chemotaxis protein
VERASLTLQYAPESEANSESVVNPVLTQLIERLEWEVHQADPTEDMRLVTIGMTPVRPKVLVVDDNEGLVELLERYLTGHACQVMAASSGQEGLELTQEFAPDAIILDVMMPEMDGWEFLQRLRARTHTASTPVIICSVINDPGLAYSLGASLFIPKPVSRDGVLRGLRQMGIV